MHAFVTLATNDEYCLGALALAASLGRVKTTAPKVCMISDQVSVHMRSSLNKIFDEIVVVDILNSNDETNLFLLKRPNLGLTFTKLHCWNLTQYSKCVFLDADTLVLQNVDDLFEREELSASPDPGWPDCFNSGVFVFSPNKQTYTKILAFAQSQQSFDGGDQGLLNEYFSDWAHKDIRKHLPFLYNVVSQAFYSYLPAFKRFGSQVKVCHFIGDKKPWNCCYSQQTGAVVPEGSGFNTEFLNHWWNVFVSSVLPLFSETALEAQFSKNKSEASSCSLAEESALPQYSIPTLSASEGASVSTTSINCGINPIECLNISNGKNKDHPRSDTSILANQEEPSHQASTVIHVLPDVIYKVEENPAPRHSSTDLLLDNLAQQFPQLSLKPQPEISVLYQPPAEPSLADHQARWEAGIIDYQGIDKFDNIKKHMDAQKVKAAAEPAVVYPPPPDVRPKSSSGFSKTSTSSSPKPKKGVLKKP